MKNHGRFSGLLGLAVLAAMPAFAAAASKTPVAHRLAANSWQVNRLAANRLAGNRLAANRLAANAGAPYRAAGAFTAIREIVLASGETLKP